MLPPQTASVIEGQVGKLIEAHNLRISNLHKQLLEEEKLGADRFLAASDQKNHQDAAKRIKEIIGGGNNNFQN
ncbi:MAG: hypothetical protein NTW80_10175 [Deltaproteobacteria bacterium]|nr:hypothetical protein [Deltaproteobacteria bacterium]